MMNNSSKYLLNKLKLIHRMKKNSLLHILILTIILSCSNSDDSNDIPSEFLLENFVEPSIDFGITQDEFRTQFSEQPDQDELGQITMFTPQNGVYQINYVFLPEGIYEDGDPVYYYFFNVIFYEYQHNFDYISNFLTQNYGEVDEVRNLAGENSISYEWYEDGFDIYLVIDADGLDASSDPPNLLLTYTQNIQD